MNSWILQRVNRFRSTLADLRWSGDWRTYRELRHPTPGMHCLSINFAGRHFPIHVRGKSIDLELARHILRPDSEYALPVHIVPRVIFDVGANIGMSALYYAMTYPRARVFCFEPLPANIELLLRNTLPFADRITVIPKGLGETEGCLPYHRSDDPKNFGGGTFAGVGCEDAGGMLLPVTTIGAVCREFGIDCIDVLKIDAEGAELSVLKGTPPSILSTTQAVIGELHGVDDLEVLRTMSQTHRVGMTKRFDRTCYPFVAVRHGLVAA